MSESNSPVWSSHLNQQSTQGNVEFCSGRDVTARPMADRELVPFDIWTNQVSSIALQKAGIISRSECQELIKILAEIESEFQTGQIELDPKQEDVHMNIEFMLEQRLGKELAGKIHTGRSRNDQSATDMRLLLRSAALVFEEELIDLVSTLLELAKTHKETICPGFSHGQPAMVTTFGHSLLCYAQALTRDTQKFNDFFTQVNRSPLGAAAGFEIGRAHF